MYSESFVWRCPRNKSMHHFRAQGSCRESLSRKPIHPSAPLTPRSRRTTIWAVSARHRRGLLNAHDEEAILTYAFDRGHQRTIHESVNSFKLRYALCFETHKRAFTSASPIPRSQAKGRHRVNRRAASTIGAIESHHYSTDGRTIVRAHLFGAYVDACWERLKRAARGRA